jgi:hypothetical protein
VQFTPACPEDKLGLNPSASRRHDDRPLIVVADDRPRRTIGEQLLKLRLAVHRIETDHDRAQFPGSDSRNDELRRVLENDRNAICSADPLREKPARQPIAQIIDVPVAQRSIEIEDRACIRRR